MTARRVAYAAGAALVVFGLIGVLRNASDTHPVGWAAWLIGLVVLHDAVLAPSVLLVSLLFTRVPAPYRRIAQATSIIAACVIAVAVPVLLGYGRRPDNPSVLPRNYFLGVIQIVTLVVLTAGAVALLSAYRRGMGRTILTILGVLLAIWLAVTVIGMIFSAIKLFFFIGLIAAVVVAIVTLVGKRSSRT